MNDENNNMNQSGRNSTTINTNNGQGLGDLYEQGMTNIATNLISEETGLDENLVGKALEKNKTNRMMNPGISQKMASNTKNILNNMYNGQRIGGQGNSSSPFDRLKASPSSPGFNAARFNNMNRNVSAQDGDSQGEDSGTKQNNPINNATSAAAEAGKQYAKDAAKKTALKLLIPIVPYVLLFLVCIFVIYCAIMLPSLLIGEKINDIKEGVTNFADKYSNFISGDGFYLSSELVTEKLKNAKKNYEDNSCGQASCYEDEFDEGILLATIQTNNIIDLSIVDQLGDDDQTDDFESGFGEEGYNDITDTQTKSFYRVQNELLGSPVVSSKIEKKDMGLIYFLVDYHVDWTCTTSSFESLESYFTSISEVISISSYKGSYLLNNNLLNYNPIFGVTEIISTLRNYFDFADQGYSFLDYAIDSGLYSEDDLDKKHLFSQIFSKEPKKCGTTVVDGKEVQMHPMPYISKYQNYTSYLNYVKDVIIPMYYFDCKKCGNYSEEEKRRIIKDTINQICDHRNSYNTSKQNSNTLICDVDDDLNINAYVSGGTTGALRGDLASLILPYGSTGFNGQIHYYSQTDYPNYTYFADRSIKQSGCGPSSLSIAVSSLLDEDHDPVELVDMTCNKKNLCTARNGTYWSAMVSVPLEYGLKSVQVGANVRGVQQVLDALATGEAIVIAIMGPGHFTTGGHFITLTGVNDQGQVFVVDPNNGEKAGKNKWWDLNIITSENNGAFWIITKD